MSSGRSSRAMSSLFMRTRVSSSGARSAPSPPKLESLALAVRGTSKERSKTQVLFMALANVPDARSHSEKGARWLGRRWLACSAAMMLRAAIFDMDGLIVDSEPLWRRTEVEVFGEVGLVVTEAMCESTTGL